MNESTFAFRPCQAAQIIYSERDIIDEIIPWASGISSLSNVLRGQLEGWDNEN